MQNGKTWEQMRAIAKRLGVPFGKATVSVMLQPGLYLIEVTPEKTLWVSIPNDAQDQALSLDQATAELMKPALAALRAHQTHPED